MKKFSAKFHHFHRILNKSVFAGYPSSPYLPTYLLTNLSSYLPTYVPTYEPIYLLNNLYSNLRTYLQTYQPTFLLTNLPTYLPTYKPTYLPTWYCYDVVICPPCSQIPIYLERFQHRIERENVQLWRQNFV